MDEAERTEKKELAAENAAEKRTLEDEIAALTATISRWQYSFFYISGAVTLAVVLQLYIIVFG